MAGMDIKTYIIESGITATEFARKLGITPGRLSQLREGPWPAELALTAETVTDGRVSASALSPVVARARGQ